MIWGRGWQTCLVKGQTVGFLGFVNHAASATLLDNSHCYGSEGHGQTVHTGMGVAVFQQKPDLAQGP